MPESKQPKRERSADMGLPAGLESEGRDDELTRGDLAHPSGAAPDHRHSVAGTRIPGGPRPAAEDTLRTPEGEDA